MSELEALPDAEDVMERFADLTPREMEVFILTGQGLTNAEIGAHLFVSDPTVKTHVKHVHDKLDIHGRARLAVAAARVANAFGEVA